MYNFVSKIWNFRATKIIAFLVLFFFVVPAFILGTLWTGCRPGITGFSLKPFEQEDSRKASYTEIISNLPNYFRREDQTYLTLPEWYIVYSADEYAAFIEKNPPSKFPYFRSIGQYWSSYCRVYALTRGPYPFNSGYHLTLFIIGTSFSIENILKGVYENIFGRITELTSFDGLSREDEYASAVAKEYGDFIHTIPWYEFPFGAKFKGLWTETGLWGPNLIRKWERKIALSAEYGVKSIYGKLIKMGTQSAYAPEDLDIYAFVSGITEEILAEELKMRVIQKLDEGVALVTIQRYEEFTNIVPRLIKGGVKFIEIAGNDEILISVIAPRNREFISKDANALFSMKVLGAPDFRRIAIHVPIKNLHSILAYLDNEGIKLEHIYDY